MEILDLDPGTMLVAGVGAAVLGSPDARRAISRGVGRAAGGVWQITRPVVMPLVDAGRDVAGEVRNSAVHHNGASRSAPTSGGRTRRTAGASA